MVQTKSVKQGFKAYGEILKLARSRFPGCNVVAAVSSNWYDISDSNHETIFAGTSDQTRMFLAIPVDHAVQPLRSGADAQQRATCGNCGLSWDDAIVTALTPTPAARCPFEYFHLD